MASPTNWFPAWSKFRTPPPGWLRALGDLIIISPVLRQLHWLPVRQRVVLKVATACLPVPVLQCSGLLGRRLSTASTRQLRSADTRTFAVNRTYINFGDRTFAAAGTRVWNSLPPDLRQSGQWDHSAVWTLLIAPSRNIVTYLQHISKFSCLWQVYQHPIEISRKPRTSQASRILSSPFFLGLPWGLSPPTHPWITIISHTDDLAKIHKSSPLNNLNDINVNV